ncbi:MAG: TonB-dependent receptor [Candidatus Neomarinimicrobiota bacterium]|nr:MAG: TonB-dependent receptor [Candidatus Neomarinimicrobiota bacterium]
MRRFFYQSIVCFILITGILFAGTTGKIAGQITDERDGTPLAGVNVVLVGTTTGAATDINGYYSILNIPPGDYTVKASMIGYSTFEIRDVRVEIDLTTKVDIRMKTQVLEGEVVEVFAQKKVIKKDVTASRLSMTSDEMETLPVSDVTDALGLKAGITSGLSIRGAGADQTLFMVDGIVMRDERTSSPMTTLPMSAMQEVSVQTGGFGAEYSNVRSGIVNVVTREGSKDSYSGSFTVRYSSPAEKHFGKSAYDPNSFYFRPFLDEEVCWTGTKNGAWDSYTQAQYYPFDGWNSISQQLLQDDDPSNDLTPLGAKRLFEWQYRKNGEINLPDRTIDWGFGGPVPVISSALGNLRFFLSHRGTQDMYLMQLATEGVYDENTMLKLTSDISSSLKMTFIGMYGEKHATSMSRSGGTAIFETPYEVANAVDRVGFTIPWRIFGDIYYSPTKRYYNTESLIFNKVLSASSFYKIQLKRSENVYRTGPMALRDTSRVYEIFPGYYVDEAPDGFWPYNLASIEGGLSLGGAVSTARDSSRYTTYTARFDYTNQINFRHQLKAGLEFVMDHYELEFGMVNLFLPEGNTWTSFERSPFRITGYIEDKIEFEGLVATLGLVPEYINSNGKWYDVGTYEAGFYGGGYNYDLESTYKTKKVKPQFYLSPRLGISHPISATSKLYFNYGHYRQMPFAERLYRMQRSYIDQVDYIGDPSLELARTVSYELGFDQSIADMYLIRVSGYYKDVKNQQDWTKYHSSDGKVAYYKLTNNSYEDIRGAEIEITKMYGDWVTGMMNFEYRVNSYGEFRYGHYYENPSEQRDWVRNSYNPYQTKPLPVPRFKSYIDFHTPRDFGPEILNQKILADWHLNVIARWTAGSWMTWNPNSIKGLEYNLRYTDTKSLDLKLAKTVTFDRFSVKVFVDVNNALNIKNWSNNAFYNVYDYYDYMYSLHLPQSKYDKMGYQGVPGNDRPGVYRDAGVEFQPIEVVPDPTTLSNPSTRAIYYNYNTKEYVKYVDGQWTQVDKKTIDEILDTKAYIDMPNQTYYTFLNPRDIFFGMTFSFDFK